MPQKSNWIWKLHFLIYLAVIIFKGLEFFLPNTEMSFYYHVLIAYDLRFMLDFLMNALAVILGFLALVPFYLHIYQRTFLSRAFWRFLLALRLVCDLTGRSYEFYFIKALYFQDPVSALDVILIGVLLYLPSYFAGFHYAFQGKH